MDFCLRLGDSGAANSATVTTCALVVFRGRPFQATACRPISRNPSAKLPKYDDDMFQTTAMPPDYQRASRTWGFGSLGTDHIKSHSPLHETHARFPDFGLCHKNGKRMSGTQDEYASGRESNRSPTLKLNSYNVTSHGGSVLNCCRGEWVRSIGPHVLKACSRGLKSKTMDAWSHGETNL